MFSIGEKVVNKMGRVFVIEEIMVKDFGCGQEDYFSLKPLYEEDGNPEYRMFVPVSKADSILKKVLSKDEALKIIDAIKDLDTLRDVSPREKRKCYDKLLASGNRMDAFRVIKALYEDQADKKRMNKPISYADQVLLRNLTDTYSKELALALDIPIRDVSTMIDKRINI